MLVQKLLTALLSLRKKQHAICYLLKKNEVKNHFTIANWTIASSAQRNSKFEIIRVKKA